MAGSASLALFQKDLQDVVKGIRAQHKRGDPAGAAFISEAFAEIKVELQSTDVFVKAEAVRKLTYLQSIGYNVSWASFGIIEVMSQARFDHKKIGYLAANQSFNESTDLILLTTNLFKKEFVNHLNSYYCMGLALNCLGNIATKDLARDCISDVLQLMSHPKPYIRKKAIITMYKIYIKYPQGFRITFDQLKDKLDDEDSSVVSCAVNVICELANKNPRNYLAMAPKFFKLLTTSSNNWMLIKVVKLLGSLVTVEPRLARKLLEPLATIVQNTSAKSLQFECIYTVTLALPFTKREDGTDAKNVPAVLNLCLHHLKVLVQDEDPNLKYLGLVGLLSLLKSHPRVVLEQRVLILNCLDDSDATIRMKSLELLVGIVTKKTMVDLVQQLLRQLQTAEGTYRDTIIMKILQMGCRARYALVTDFLWYVSVLQRLACIKSSGCDIVDSDDTIDNAAGPADSSTAVQLHSGATIYGYGYNSTTRYSRHGREVAEQLMEIALRVENSRAFIVECMVSLLMNSQLLLQGPARDTVCEVFMAASWVVGEYPSILMDIMLDRKQNDDDDDDDDESESESEDSDSDRSGSAGGDDEGFWIEGPDGTELRSRWRKLPLHLLLIETLLHPRVTTLPPRVQGSFIHASLKIFIAAVTPQYPSHYLAQIVTNLRLRLPLFLQSVHLEVQERATTFQQLLIEFQVLAVDEDGGVFRDTKSKHHGDRDSSDDEGDAEGDSCADIDQTVDDLLIFLPEESMSFQNNPSSAPGAPSVVDRATPGIAAAQHAHQSAVLGAHPTAADRKGAAMALSHQGPLRVLSAESFYTVHPKAQQKVPVPVGVDLELAFNSKALKRVLALTEPSNPSIGTLSFLGKDKVAMGSSFSSSSNSNVSPYSSQALDHDDSGSGGGDSMFRDSTSGGNYQDEPSFDSRSRNANQDHFYIKSTNPDANEMNGDDDGDESVDQKRRAEYEDILVGGISTEVRRRDLKNKSGTGEKKHNKKLERALKKGDKSKSKSKTAHINQIDLVPGGESLSDDEIVSERNSKKRGKKSKKSDGGDSDDSDAGLEDIDITRPLRASDVLPVHKHRETPVHQPTTGDYRDGSASRDEGDSTGLEGVHGMLTTVSGEKKSRKSNKSKDKKMKKSKKDKSKETKTMKGNGTSSAEGDLLGMSWEQLPSPSISIDTTSSSKTKSRKSDKSSSQRKSTSQIWIPLYEHNDHSFDVSYSIDYDASDSAGNVKLSYRVENSGSPLSLSLQLTNVPGPLQAPRSSSLLVLPGSDPADSLLTYELVSQLPSGEDRVVAPGSDYSLSLSLLESGALEALLQMVQGEGIAADLHFTWKQAALLDQGGSPSPSTRKVAMSPTICSFCNPLRMSINDFTALLSNESGTCGQAKTRLGFNTTTFSKPKKVLKLLSKYLHGHEVESVGDGQAMSLSCLLGPNGDKGVKICILLKLRKSSEVSVEVKCFGKMKGQVCQQVANAIVTAVDIMDLH